MSIAKITRIDKVRKDWKCGKCGSLIRKDQDGRLSFTVGYRGLEHTRCLSIHCYPTLAERESSAVSRVYEAIEGINFGDIANLEGLYAARDAVAEACEEVAEEYETSEMFDISDHLEERVDMLRSAAQELWGWEPSTEGPEENPGECPECAGRGEMDEDEEGNTYECDACEGCGVVDALHEPWLEDVQQELHDAVMDLELP